MRCLALIALGEQKADSRFLGLALWQAFLPKPLPLLANQFFQLRLLMCAFLILLLLFWALLSDALLSHQKVTHKVPPFVGLLGNSFRLESLVSDKLVIPLAPFFVEQKFAGQFKPDELIGLDIIVWEAIGMAVERQAAELCFNQLDEYIWLIH